MPIYNTTVHKNKIIVLNVAKTYTNKQQGKGQKERSTTNYVY